MATDTSDKIPTFRRSEFATFLQTLRSACTTGNGSIALTAQHDPITSHVNDPFVKLALDNLSARERSRFNSAIPSAKAILLKPNLVEDALPHLVHFKAFSYIVPSGQKDNANLFRADYLALKAACTQWTNSEAAVYRTCVESLRKGDMLELCDEEISANFSGRLLLQKITDAGSKYSDKAASELITRMVTNKMLPSESVTKYHTRHIGILKSLRRRGLEAEDILKLIEKTVFVNGLPDETFGNMKNIIAFNKQITLDEIVTEAKDVENLDGIRFATEHGGTSSTNMVGRINLAPAIKSKKACWNVLLNGTCSNQNCQFSHNRDVIMQASLDMARGRITPPRSWGRGGGHGGRGRGRGRGGGRGGGRGRGQSGGRYRQNRSGPTDKCKKEGPCPLRGHGNHARSECETWKSMRKECMEFAVKEVTAHINKTGAAPAASASVNNVTLASNNDSVNPFSFEIDFSTMGKNAMIVAQGWSSPK